MSMKKKLAVVAASSAALAGISICSAVPAQAAVYASLHAYYDYSSARADSTAGEWTRSSAWHGNQYARSGWYNQYSWAFADSGWSSYFGARVEY